MATMATTTPQANKRRRLHESQEVEGPRVATASPGTGTVANEVTNEVTPRQGRSGDIGRSGGSSPCSSPIGGPGGSSGSPSTSPTSGPSVSPSKSPKTTIVPTKVLTFGVSHSRAQVQLLPRHTVYDLIDIICKSTAVGYGGMEQVYDHMWNVHVQGRDEAYESYKRTERTALGGLNLEAGTELVWEYDYGANWTYKITFLGESEESLPETAFPKTKDMERPSGYAKHTHLDVDINLNREFQDFHKWAFVTGTGVSLNFFQPGGTRNNYGYMERGNGGCRRMFLLRANLVPSQRDLGDYLRCFDFSTRDDRCDESPDFNWESRVVLPEASATDSLLAKGFQTPVVVPANPSTPKLNEAFPKIAALAGYRKDPKVKKGWMTYKDGNLILCTGKGTPSKGKHDFRTVTAFYGIGMHEPLEGSSEILRELTDNDRTEIKSLHDLFCVAEGLLRSI